MRTRWIRGWLPIAVALLQLVACGDDDEGPTDTGPRRDGEIPDTGPRDTGTRDTGEEGDFDLGEIEVTITERVAPGATFDVTVMARNTGDAAWAADNVTLVYDGDEGASDTDLTLTGDTAAGAVGAFRGTLTAPGRTGFLVLSWQPTHGSTAFGPQVVAATEVTCSDGIFCNGIERFAGGRCVEGPDPCDDGQACTTDACDETTGRCSRSLGADCSSCRSECTPMCAGRTCGPDGCGGDCGTCPGDESCALGPGACRAVSQAGTCSNPIPLVPMGVPLVGQHLIVGDTSIDAIHQLIPSCNATSTAVELVYSFTTTERLGLDARSFGYDTVLYLLRDCTDDSAASTIGCSDDTLPPGDYGSRVAVAIDPGTYFLIVDGFDDTQLGPFELSVRFVAGGCVPACDGRFCGDDDGCGGDCGTCDAGFACTDGRCVMDPCVPQCDGRECGDDGCGATCGDCTGTDLCVPATGTCQSFQACLSGWHPTPQRLVWGHATCHLHQLRHAVVSAAKHRSTSLLLRGLRICVPLAVGSGSRTRDTQP